MPRSRLRCRDVDVMLAESGRVAVLTSLLSFLSKVCHAKILIVLNSIPTGFISISHHKATPRRSEKTQGLEILLTPFVDFTVAITRRATTRR